MSVYSELVNKISFKPNTKRLPIFGLGCLGGVAGINRVNDYLKGHPKEAALLLATELCSLTFQFEDKSVANLVGTRIRNLFFECSIVQSFSFVSCEIEFSFLYR